MPHSLANRPPRALSVALLVALASAGTRAAAPDGITLAERFNETHDPPAVSSRSLPDLSVRWMTGVTPPVINSQWLIPYGYDALLHPPDPHGAAGPRGIIATVNRNISCYDKPGNPIWPTLDFQVFLAPLGPAEGSMVDPRAAYDPGTGRFYVIEAEYNDTDTYLDIAVSKSSNPTSSGPSDWFFYRVLTTEVVGGARYGGDYPGLGFDGQNLYVTYNMYFMPGFAFFKNCQIIVLDKAALISGTAIARSVFTPDGYGAGFTLQPATVIGASSPGSVAYFAEVPYWGTTTAVRIWALADPQGAGILTSTTVPAPDNGGQAEGAPQCAPGTVLISTFSPRAQGNAFWHAGSLWFCHTAGGSALGRGVVYYYRVATNGFPGGSPGLEESGAIDGGPGVWTYQPAVGANADGDVGLVYTQSSATICPTIMVAARKAAWSAFAPPQVLKEGTYYNATRDLWGNIARWGDYATVSGDPVDNSLWVSHEFAPDTQPDHWSTWWGNIVFDPGVSAWQTDGVPLRVSTTGVEAPAGVPDRAGGAIVAWRDGRNSVSRVFLQRVTGSGAKAPGWPANGVPATAGLRDAGTPALAPDDSGGAYVAWAIVGGADVLLQRITDSGTVAPGWPADGVALGTPGASPAIVADGTGGAFVAWQSSGIRLVRVRSTGAIAPGWPAGGLGLASSGALPQLVPDGAGGVIVAWTPGLRLQRVSGDGIAQWQSGGVSLGPGASPRMISDGQGGAVLAFQKWGAGSDLYALRISSAGAVATGWAAGGVVLCGAPSDQTGPVLVPDGTGGAIVAWKDARDDPGGVLGDIYALRVNGSGGIPPGWPANGMAICAAAGDQSAPAIAADSVGGAVVAWQDGRGSPGCTPPGCGEDIYFQRVTGLGTRDSTLAADGTVVCTAAGTQARPCLVGAARGAPIVAWEDGRLFPDCDPVCGSAVYAQQVRFDAVAPAAAILNALTTSCSETTVSWVAPGDDGMTGRAAAYDLRESSLPISSEELFSAATRVPTPPPHAAGTLESITIPYGACSGPRFYALVTRDAVPNRSGMSVSPHGVATPCPPPECDSVVAVFPGAQLPRAVHLSPPAPNPAASEVVFRFGIPLQEDGTSFELGVYDLAGRLVARVDQGTSAAGFHARTWDLRSAGGARVRAGLYFARLRLGRHSLSRPLLVTR
ncbi:MAG: hypothetical protein HZC42_05105 [Candidatus Eisenbacteria bacterium]|nr:hypothetical protein [Candidatus Eisenbacteria bacterium]